MAGHMMRIWCLFIAFCQHAAWGQSSYPAFPPGGLPSVAPAEYPNYQRADYQSSAIPQPYQRVEKGVWNSPAGHNSQCFSAASKVPDTFFNGLLEPGANAG